MDHSPLVLSSFQTPFKFDRATNGAAAAAAAVAGVVAAGAVTFIVIVYATISAEAVVGKGKWSNFQGKREVCVVFCVVLMDQKMCASLIHVHVDCSTFHTKRPKLELFANQKWGTI